MSHFFGKGGIGGFLGRTFSLKNLVPDVLGVGGFLLGGPLGAGLGYGAGGLIEGQSPLQALEGGALAGLGGAALGGLGGLSGIGGDISSGLSDIGLGGLGSAVSTGLSGIGSGLSSLAGDIGFGGAASSGGGFLGNIGSDISGAVSGVGSDISSGLNDLGLGGVSSSLGLPSATGAVADAGSSGLSLGGDSLSELAGTGGGVGTTAAADSTSLLGDSSLSSLSTGAATPVAAAGGLNDAVASSSLAGAGGIGSTASGLFSGLTTKDMLAVAPLALDVLKSNSAYPGQNNIASTAASLSSQGQSLASYLQNGTLPPGAQAAINQATAAATASIRSQYASMGMGGSSAEAQSIASAQQAGVTQATQLATNLLQTGISEQQVSAQLYQEIMAQSMQQDQALSQSIGLFASAMT